MYCSYACSAHGDIKSKYYTGFFSWRGGGRKRKGEGGREGIFTEEIRGIYNVHVQCYYVVAENHVPQCTLE